MNALASKYTEETYLTYEELKRLFLPAQLEAVWREIALYRELFVIDLPDQAFVIHSIHLQKLHGKVEKLINRMVREGNFSNQIVDQLGLGHEVIASLKRKYQMQYSYSLRDICKELQMDYTDFMKFLDGNELPLMVQLFLIMTKTKDWLQRILLLYLGHETCCHEILFLLAEQECVLDIGNDQTKSYAKWLEQLHAVLQRQLLKQRERWNASYLKELRLLERYPTLKPYQAEFFEQHRAPGHYYTVEQFLLACNTCYETARMSMEEFVRLGWYKKEKCGKKYVYFVSN